MNVLVFDIETVPDVDLGRRLHDLGDLSDEDVAKVLFTRRRQQTGTEFVQHHMHRVVAISLVLRTARQFKVWSLGDESSDEAEIIRRFFEGIDRYQPTLVSWNGGGFDLARAPLPGHASRYRGALLLGGGRNRPGLQVEQLPEPFPLAAYRSDGRAVRLPGACGRPPWTKSLSCSASRVNWACTAARCGRAFVEGRIGDIRDYCETDVLNTFLVYLRYELMRGNLDGERLEREFQAVADSLRAESKPSSRPVPGGMGALEVAARPKSWTFPTTDAAWSRIDGKVYFVEGALPGEEVSFERLRRHRGHETGRLQEVERCSADRGRTALQVLRHLWRLRPAAPVRPRRSCATRSVRCSTTWSGLGGVEPEGAASGGRRPGFRVPAQGPAGGAVRAQEGRGPGRVSRAAQVLYHLARSLPCAASGNLRVAARAARTRRRG